jgi:hypothetical protein
MLLVQFIFGEPARPIGAVLTGASWCRIYPNLTGIARTICNGSVILERRVHLAKGRIPLT